MYVFRIVVDFSANQADSAPHRTGDIVGQSIDAPSGRRFLSEAAVFARVVVINQPKNSAPFDRRTRTGK